MTGSRAGVIGVRREQALRGFKTQMPVRFDTAEEDAKAETAALIKDLKEQLQKAEASSDEYKV